MDKDKLQKEINELIEQREDFQKKVSEIQQQIDSKVLELESVPNLKNKYIYYRNEMFGCDVYMLVKNYTRTFNGLQLEGYIVNIFDYGSAEIVTDYHDIVDYNKVSEIKEITKEFFNETIRNKINNMIDKIDQSGAGAQVITT